MEVNTCIDVIDSGCSVRRKRIAVRAQQSMLELEFPRSDWEVFEFGSADDWLREVKKKSYLATHIVFLHASDNELGWQSIVSEFGRRVQLRLLGRGLLVSYTGGLRSRVEAGEYRSGETLWWRHCPGAAGVRDFLNIAQAVRVGETDPPVAEPIRAVFSRKAWNCDTSAAEETEGVDAAAFGAEVRHAIVNAVGPLREAAELALVGRRKPKDLDELWAHLKDRLVPYQRRLPEWVGQVIESLDLMLPGALEEPSKNVAMLQSLVLDLARIQSYARTIGLPERNWDDVESIVGGAFAKNTARILWIDDERAWYLATKSVFERCGIEVTFSETPMPWIENLAQVAEFDAVMLDIILDGHGSSIAGAVQRAGIATADPIVDANAGIGLLLLFGLVPLGPPVFMLSARESPSVIQACIRFGARGYLTKAAPDYLQFLTSLQREIAARRERRRDAIRPINSKLIVSGPRDPLGKVLVRLEHIAKSGTRGPVVLSGEPGVGKGELALELHQRSARRGHPFVVADCSAIAPTLVETELFGHVRGAFTDAIRDREGRFEQAHGGTLFIDEIDKTEVALQNKLLRVVETGRLSRVGEGSDRTVDVMLIIASNADLKRAASAGTFSQPLFSRLEKFSFAIPPLRERVEAVPELAEGLCRRLCEEYGRDFRALSPDAVEWLRVQAACGAFDGMGGNIRGLHNIIEATLVYNPGDGPVERRHLQDASDFAKQGSESRQTDEAFREAARILAEYVAKQGQTSLKFVEEKFRAELFKALRARMTREQIRILFGMKADLLRQYFQQLREKGLLPPGV